MNLIALGLGLVAVGALTWTARRLWRVCAIGAAYKAQILATAIFGAERDIDPRRAAEISADSYWPLRFFDVTIDRDSRLVTASFLGLRPYTASFPRSPSRQNPERWHTRSETRLLREVVERAFTDPAPRRLRRTRAVLVIQDDMIVAERYADGFGPDSPFAGWSMTKGILSALFGILVGQGRFALDDRELMPHWNPPDPRARISLEDLLRMRSGLSFSEVYDDMSSDVIEMLYNSPDVVAYAAGRPLAVAPGTQWSYASGSTNILSGVMRRVLGDAYHSWPRQALFDPLDMQSAVLGTDRAGNLVFSSYMLATARDWARFGMLHAHDGVWNGRRLLPEGWVRFCTTPTPQSPAGRYGAHWWLKLQPEIGGETLAATRIPADAFFAVGHEGQTLTVIPSRRLVIVRLGLSIYIDAWDQAMFVADVVDALS